MTISTIPPEASQGSCIKGRACMQASVWETYSMYVPLEATQGTGATGLRACSCNQCTIVSSCGCAAIVQLVKGMSMHWVSVKIWVHHDALRHRVDRTKRVDELHVRSVCCRAAGLGVCALVRVLYRAQCALKLIRMNENALFLKLKMAPAAMFYFFRHSFGVHVATCHTGQQVIHSACACLPAVCCDHELLETWRHRDGRVRWRELFGVC